MKLGGFWSGVAASIVSGIALYLLFSFYEGKPSLTWSSIGRFQLPSKDNEDIPYNFFQENALETFIVSNSGFQPARNVRVEYTGSATEVIAVSASGQQSFSFGSEQDFIEIPAIAPRSQVQVAVFVSVSGSLRVIFDGVEVDQNYGRYIVVMDGNRWIRVPDVITLIFLFSVLAPASFTIIALTFGVPGGVGRKDNSLEKNDEKNI